VKRDTEQKKEGRGNLFLLLPLPTINEGSFLSSQRDTGSTVIGINRY
jgi:hypothetical protein